MILRSLSELTDLRMQYTTKGHTIGWTGSCFDIIHPIIAVYRGKFDIHPIIVEYSTSAIIRKIHLIYL